MVCFLAVASPMVATPAQDHPLRPNE